MSDEAEQLRLLAECLQTLGDEYLEGRLEYTAFLDQVKATGVSPEQGAIFIAEILQQSTPRTPPDGLPPLPLVPAETPILRSSAPPPQLPEEALRGPLPFLPRPVSRDPSPQVSRERSPSDAGSPDYLSRPPDPNAAAWAALAHLNPANKPSGVGSPLKDGPTKVSDVLKRLKPFTPSATISTVLAGAPHLANLINHVPDAHISETLRLRRLFSADKACDELIDMLQGESIREPLPRGIWKDIILDRLVFFEKLLAALDCGFEWTDEPKEFTPGFIIAKKDSYTTKKPLRTEADWIRVFSSWEEAVVRLYPHRRLELVQYRNIVMDLFRGADEALAIKFDADVRARYAKNPFRMDDQNLLNKPLFSQMFLASRAGSSNRFSPYPRPGGLGAGSSAASAPRAQTVCDNWNFGKCEETPCRNRRRHGVCSECSGSHRAKEIDACFTKLKRRRFGSQGDGNLSAQD
jgi:hypothetical protein